MASYKGRQGFASESLEGIRSALLVGYLDELCPGDIFQSGDEAWQNLERTLGRSPDHTCRCTHIYTRTHVHGQRTDKHIHVYILTFPYRGIQRTCTCVHAHAYLLPVKIYNIFMYTYINIFVCMYACMYVGPCVSQSVCLCLSLSRCLSVCLYVCMDMLQYVCLNTLSQ